MLRKLNSKNRGGFTLVEIMIVVAIIALLAAIAVPNFLRSRKRSQATQILEDLRQIDSAKDQYAIENNKKGADAVTWANVQAYLKADPESANRASQFVTDEAAAESAKANQFLADLDVKIVELPNNLGLEIRSPRIFLEA